MADVEARTPRGGWDVMTVWRCDGCGETATGEHKPHSWFSREDTDGVQVACSRWCIEKVAAATLWMHHREEAACTPSVSSRLNQE